jgi:hypothetical protein
LHLRYIRERIVLRKSRQSGLTSPLKKTIQVSFLLRFLFNDIVGVSKPKSPLVVRHDNSIGNITQRLSSDSKTPIPSSHSNMKRVSMGEIYSEKEKKALETRPENYQGQATGEPDLNKRSYSINLSPPTHWNSRVTSKKISVCDFSQDIQDLQKEYDISHDRKNKGSISSRPSFDMYKEYMNRNLFSQNSSPFALYSEFAKPKKDIPQAYSANKLKFIDTRALDNSPVSRIVTLIKTGMDQKAFQNMLTIM